MKQQTWSRSWRGVGTAGQSEGSAKPTLTKLLRRLTDPVYEAPAAPERHLRPGEQCRAERRPLLTKSGPTAVLKRSAGARGRKVSWPNVQSRISSAGKKYTPLGRGGGDLAGCPDSDEQA